MSTNHLCLVPEPETFAVLWLPLVSQALELRRLGREIARRHPALGPWPACQVHRSR